MWAHSLRIWFIIAGKVQQWEHESTGHISSSQKENSNECLYPANFLFLILFRTLAQGIVTLTFSTVFPISMNLFTEIPHKSIHKLNNPSKVYQEM